MRNGALMVSLLLTLLSEPARADPQPEPNPEAGTESQSTSTSHSARSRQGLSGSQHRFEWRWSRFNALDYAFTATAGLTYLYIEFFTVSPSEPKWTGGILFDDSVRDATVARSRSGRERAGLISDYMTLAPQAFALVDAAIVPLVSDDLNFDVAWQMSVMNLQALAITGILTRGGHRVIARERPDVAPCRDDGEYHELCFGGSNAAFPSGHTSGAFVGAGLVCAHHLNLPLYGHPVADLGACAANTALATSSAILRLVADRHYVTDVIVGAGIGAGAGFVLPMLLHYRPVDLSQGDTVSWMLAPVATTESLGLGAVGLF